MEDISANPVVKHPHNTSRTVPERLPATKINELSTLEPLRSVLPPPRRNGWGLLRDRV